MDIFKRIFRNCYGVNCEWEVERKVYCDYCKMPGGNLGDDLAPIIYKWMLQKNGIDENHRTKKAIHLMTVGSLLGCQRFDAVVWGSGILNLQMIGNIARHKNYRKYDIRLLRGPLSRQVMIDNGYSVPAENKVGDPALLMPLIYKPIKSKKYEVSMINHFFSTAEAKTGVHKISIKTNDYQYFIDEIVASQKIISSSLHGIILAEAYGVPAVFYAGENENQMFKFLDYYYSTGRKNVKAAYALDEAINMDPMPLPEIEQMQNIIMNAFPLDLYI